MYIELIEPEAIKKDVKIVLTNDEAVELCTFFGHTSSPRRRDACSVIYDDGVICNIFSKLTDLVECR